MRHFPVEHIDLIHQAVDGDDVAFKRVVDLYSPMVFHICKGLLTQVENAEDVTQEVFIELYFKLPDFKFNSKFSTWVYKIAVNKSLDYIRKHSAEKRGKGKVISADEDKTAFLITSDDLNPHEYLEQDEQRMILKNAIAQLPERQRTAFVLARVDGIDQTEVAQMMETTVGAVESLLTRANKELRTILVQLNPLAKEKKVNNVL